MAYISVSLGREGFAKSQRDHTQTHTHTHTHAHCGTPTHIQSRGQRLRRRINSRRCRAGDLCYLMLPSSYFSALHTSLLAPLHTLLLIPLHTPLHTLLLTPLLAPSLTPLLRPHQTSSKSKLKLKP